MNNTKIEWCDKTWNPVTGCLHGCPYCYARKYAYRFGAFAGFEDENERYFDPKFRKDRLDQPAKTKKPKNIFVCSMADLFGEWVPDEWIKAVFDACRQAPQHRYFFLTKNPKGIWRATQSMIDAWYGTSISCQADCERISFLPLNKQRFLSIEPILEPIDLDKRPARGAIPYADWVIVGAETGSRKGKIIPKRRWIEKIVAECQKRRIPVFLKDSLAEVWGEPLVQEYPWEKRTEKKLKEWD